MKFNCESGAKTEQTLREFLHVKERLGTARTMRDATLSESVERFVFSSQKIKEESTRKDNYRPSTAATNDCRVWLCRDLFAPKVSCFDPAVHLSSAPSCSPKVYFIFQIKYKLTQLTER